MDPSTGQTTLEYIFNSNVVPGTHYNGLGELVVNGISDQYFDFYNNAGVAEVFLYCGGTAAWCTTEDHIRPGIAPAVISDVTLNPGTLPFPNSSPFDAASYTPGTGPGQSTYLSNAAGYSVLFNANSDVFSTPEPTSVILFGSVLLLVGGAVRRRLAR